MTEHYKPVYPAETFGFMDTERAFEENRRSKSKEHTERLCNCENSRKTEKIKENDI